MPYFAVYMNELILIKRSKVFLAPTIRAAEDLALLDDTWDEWREESRSADTELDETEELS